MADVSILGSLIASAKQQHHLSSSNGVRDSIALADVDAQFPYSIAAKLVIAEVAQLNPVDSSVNRDSGICVPELPAPFHEDIFLVLRQVMANLVHLYSVVYKRICVKL